MFFLQYPQNLAADLHRLSLTTQSSRVARIALLVRSKNPFTKVIEEIRKAIDNIELEGEEDAAKKKWCNSERSELEQKLEEAQTEEGLQQSNMDDATTQIKLHTETMETEKENIEEQHKAIAAVQKLRDEESAQFSKHMGDLEVTTTAVETALMVLSNLVEISNGLAFFWGDRPGTNFVGTIEEIRVYRFNSRLL